MTWKGLTRTGFQRERKLQQEDSAVRKGGPAGPAGSEGAGGVRGHRRHPGGCGEARAGRVPQNDGDAGPTRGPWCRGPRGRGGYRRKTWGREAFKWRNGTGGGAGLRAGRSGQRAPLGASLSMPGRAPHGRGRKSSEAGSAPARSGRGRCRVIPSP